MVKRQSPISASCQARHSPARFSEANAPPGLECSVSPSSCLVKKPVPQLRRTDSGHRPNYDARQDFIRSSRLHWAKLFVKLRGLPTGEMISRRENGSRIEMLFADEDDRIRQVSAHAADDLFNVGVPLRRGRCRENVIGAERTKTATIRCAGVIRAAVFLSERLRNFNDCSTHLRLHFEV